MFKISMKVYILLIVTILISCIESPNNNSNIDNESSAINEAPSQDSLTIDLNILLGATTIDSIYLINTVDSTSTIPHSIKLSMPTNGQTVFSFQAPNPLNSEIQYQCYMNNTLISSKSFDLTSTQDTTIHSTPDFYPTQFNAGSDTLVTLGDKITFDPSISDDSDYIKFTFSFQCTESYSENYNYAYESEGTFTACVKVFDGYHTIIDTVIITVEDITIGSIESSSAGISNMSNASSTTFSSSVALSSSEHLPSSSTTSSAEQPSSSSTLSSAKQPSSSSTVSSTEQPSSSSTLSSSEQLSSTVSNSSNSSSSTPITNTLPTTNDTTAYITENEILGSVITFTHIDPEGSPLEYSIKSGNVGNYFELSQGGILTLTKAVNYESYSSFNLSIQVTDASISKEFNLTIHVDNINEPPTINESSLFVDENTPINTTIATITSTDPEGSTIKYYLVGSQLNTLFAIHPISGVVTPKVVIDYETNTFFDLVLQAEDEENTITHTIRLTVNNEIDDCRDFTIATDEICDARDLHIYTTVIIDSTTWMAENLNYDAGDLSYCYGVSDYSYGSNCDTYGRIYEWSAALGIHESFNRTKLNTNNIQKQGVCPAGWHLPSQTEWADLAQYIVDDTGLDSIQYGHWMEIGVKLKTVSGWDVGPAWGDNAYGFAAKPGGDHSSIGFWGIGKEESWWSYTEGTNGDGESWEGEFAYGTNLAYNRDSFIIDEYSKTNAYSIRCTK